MRTLNEGNVGSYVGDTAAQTKTLGYKPLFVFVYNETDGNDYWFHIQGAAAASALQSAAGTTSFITSDGITLTDTGFTIGTALSESGDTFRFIAY